MNQVEMFSENRKSGAALNRGGSKQDYQTPVEFIRAVESRFGALDFDLAATQENKITPRYFGPGSPLGEDSIKQDWHKLSGILWLNPPYADIGLWARKCKQEAKLGARIRFLVPASVGSNWFWDYVEPAARVYALQPRLSFDGKNPYPKDLILAVYDVYQTGLYRWRWK